MLVCKWEAVGVKDINDYSDSNDDDYDGRVSDLYYKLISIVNLSNINIDRLSKMYNYLKLNKVNIDDIVKGKTSWKAEIIRHYTYTVLQLCKTEEPDNENKLQQIINNIFYNELDNNSVPISSSPLYQHISYLTKIKIYLNNKLRISSLR